MKLSYGTKVGKSIACTKSYNWSCTDCMSDLVVESVEVYRIVMDCLGVKRASRMICLSRKRSS